MAKNTGTLVTAQIKKYDSLDQYPVVAAEDCSVIEQNGITGANVQEALENLSVIDILYEDFYNGVDGLVDTASLTPGQRYRITNFRTRHLIPNTSITNGIGATNPEVNVIGYDNNSGTGIDVDAFPVGLLPGAQFTLSGTVNGTWDGTYVAESLFDYGDGTWEISTPDTTFDGDVVGGVATWLNIHAEVIEPITVMAATTSAIHEQVISALHPEDIIYYELIDTCGQGDRGRILRRRDTLNDRDCPGDWRVAKYRRWERTEGEGDYNSLTDTGFAYQDYFMFNESSTGVFIGHRQDISFDTYTYPNIVFKHGVEFIMLGAESANIHFDALLVHRNTFCCDVDDVVFLGTCKENRFEGCLNNTTFLKDCTNNVIGVSSLSGAIIAEDFLNNVIESERLIGTGLPIDGEIQRCYIGVFPASMEDTLALNHYDEGVKGGNNLWSVTYTDLVAIVAASELVVHQRYRVTDRSNAIVEATSANTYRPYQDCVGSMDWDSTTSLIGNETSDVITLLGAGGTYETDILTDGPAWPVKFQAETGYSFTFLGTSYESISADGQFLWQGEITINSLYGDWLTLEKKIINNGTEYEVWVPVAKCLYE